MNPYDAPATTPEVDVPMMRLIAIKLSNSRQNPPTVFRTLTTWPGVPLMALFGILGMLALTLLAMADGWILKSQLPIGLACFVFGAIVRDIGYARRATRIWPVQAEFINWDKVDQFAKHQP